MSINIAWTDTTGAASLDNGLSAPGNLLSTWTPKDESIGVDAYQVSTGRNYGAKFRRDGLVSFELHYLPGSNVALALRLKLHLMKGGAITLTTANQLNERWANATLAPGTVPSITFADNVMLEYTFGVVLRQMDVSAPCVPAPLGGDYSMLLDDVTDLASVMALSYDMDDYTPYAYAGFGNHHQREVAGKRMINAAGLEVVNDVTAANGARYLKILTAPNAGENGYGFQNFATLFPADIYPDFYVEFWIRNAEGSLGLPFVTIQSTYNFQGVGIYRDSVTRKYMLDANDISFDYTTGFEMSPAAADTDMVHVLVHVVLTNRFDKDFGTNPARADYGLSRAVQYDASYSVTLSVNDVITGTQVVTGVAASSRFPEGSTSATSVPGAIAPWQLICPHESFPDVGTQEFHGSQFLVCP